jgi:2-hydroxychromene-2-carboxylate isomerase
MAELRKEAYGPHGDAASHQPLAALDAALRALPAPPRDAGRLALIVRRHPDGVRATLDRVTLSTEEGVPGDGWSRRPPRDPQAQLAVMRRDVAELIANGQPLTLFGDNLFVDLDLSAPNLPVGTRLRAGSAVVEMTPKPHNGCLKFKGRFGADALALVQRAQTRDQNLRGVYWRVIEPGDARVGDAIEVLSRPRGDLTVEFFFSPGSRYCYLAASQLPRIAERAGCGVEWRPVRGAEIRALRGRDPFSGEAVSGQYDWGYRQRDAEMWADYYGIPFREPPSHEFDFELLSRAAAAGARLGAAESVGWALCSLVYGSPTWPFDRDACLTVAEQQGLSRAQFDAALDDPATDELLRANARDAHARGAFGVPTLFHGGVLYWGNDRLALLEHALTRT